MPPTHFRTCNLCEAMCGITVEHEGGRILAIRGDRDDPFSRGHICPKAVALQDVHEDPDRLRRPLRRRGRDWEEVGWEEAFQEAAERLAAVQKSHGRNAVAVYLGNPTVHNHGSILFSQLFLKALGSRSRFSATSVDQLPHMLAALLMFGHQLLLPVPDVDRTDFMLIFGANPVASNGSLMTAPGIERRLKEIRRRGGRVIVVDPRRTETAALADRHVPIRPGTDALLLLALLNTLFEEGHVRTNRILDMSDGLEAVATATKGFTPEAVSGPTGVAAPLVRELASEFVSASAAVCYGRVGVSTQEFGGLCCWLINVINAVTGNLDRTGGAMFARPAADLLALADRLGQRGHFDKGRSRVRGLPEFGGEWPVAVLAEEIETEGPGRIRALVSSAGNPVLSSPNGARLGRALAGLDFMVAIDIYLNETTRHAHLLLPPTFALEHSHYDLVFHALAVRDTAKYSPALFPAAPDQRHDWEILLELATRLRAARGEGAVKARLQRAIFRVLHPDRIIAWLLRTGPHGAGWRPFGPGLTLGRLRDSVHGVDLGPLAPSLPGRLYTANQRIDLAPARLVADVERARNALRAVAGDGGLRLIGRRDLRSNNSWMHNSPRLVKGRDRCTLLMHPRDAAFRALTAGQKVRIRSRAGSVVVALELTEEVMPGVVSLPHGWGHAREGTRIRVANEHPGASLNDLTDEQLVDPLSGNARLSGVPVEVTPAPA